MPRRVFVDSVYWIARAHPRDHWHSVATDVTRQLTDVQFVTTDGVFSEVLARTTQFGHDARNQGLRLYDNANADPSVTIVHIDAMLFARGIDLYRSNSESRLSLQDCIAIVVMRDLAITDILTGGSEFAAHGFNVLMQR